MKGSKRLWQIMFTKKFSLGLFEIVPFNRNQRCFLVSRFFFSEQIEEPNGSNSSLSAVLFAREVVRLVNKSGCLFTAMYLSQCTVCLQHYYADSAPMEGSSMSPYVSLTRSGIPKIIPSFHRKVIRGSDRERANRITKLYMSWFTVGRLVKLAKRPSKSLFRSITQDADFVSIQVYAEQFRMLLPVLIERYIPWVWTVPVFQGLSWRPT